MATTRTQISNGSKNDDVTELQRILNSKGYDLEEDGIFGSKTEAAVRDYQTKNKLNKVGCKTLFAKIKEYIRRRTNLIRLTAS